jgi:hypothetical protein
MKYSNNINYGSDRFPSITNWKLREVIQDVEIVDNDSLEYEQSLLEKLLLPKSIDYTGIIRSETIINWTKMSKHYSFFFDLEGWENLIQKAFMTSNLNKVNRLIINYGWEEPAVKIPTELFFEDWEGFIRSMHYEGLMFSDDFNLIMEISKDYYLHSNFFIMEDCNR